MITLQTAQALLRPFTLNDAPDLLRITNQPGIMQYFPNPTPPTPERIDRMINNQIEHWTRHGYGWWALVFRDSNQLLGWCGLQYLPDTDEIEVGYLIDQRFQKLGITTEAATASLMYGFLDLEITTIIGITHPDNTASQRVLLKSGLTLTGPAHYFGMDCLRFAAHCESWSDQFAC
ncbi:MAG: GNAT family N-acetyltransferase [Anaerolineales bacterium]|nr:GNAT family N-acetyltransferase [Anaerolineales bacterium]